jgi:hypothetical protein
MEMKKKLATLMLAILMPRLAIASEYNEAVRKAAEAFAVQSGIKDNLENRIRDIERRYVPVVIVQNGGVLIFLVQGFVGDQWRIGYTWEF